MGFGFGPNAPDQPPALAGRLHPVVRMGAYHHPSISDLGGV